MKYLRSYLLVPGAGSQLLGSRSAKHRNFRRLTTSHHQSEVTSSNSSRYRSSDLLGQRRPVSTDGAKKSQLAVVGQVVPALPPLGGAEIETYLAVSCPRHDDAKPETPSRRDALVPPNDSETSPETPSYGQILFEANSLGIPRSLDPISLEMAFLPTFHAFKNDLNGLFFANRPKSATVPYHSPGATQNSPDNIENSEGDVSLERSKSLEALLPTPDNLEDSPQNIPRHVKREIVLPRHFEPECVVSKNPLDSFLKIHGFQKNINDDDEKSDDVCQFPKCDDSPDFPSGQFIIQSDRSSVIIHRDLYITNRILEKLKKKDEPPEIAPEPTVKASAACSVSGTRDQCETDLAASAIGSKSRTGTVKSSAAEIPICRESSSPVVHTNSQASRILCGQSTHPNLLDIDEAKRGECNSNIEFKLARDQMSPLESEAFQSRKNLYARMRTASPCVLVDGLHVKQAKLEDMSVSSGNSDTVASCLATSLSNLLPVPDSVISSSSFHENPQDFSLVPLETNNCQDFHLVYKEINPICHLPPSTASLVEYEIDSTFQGLADSNQFDLIPQDLEQSNVQGDLEDWFIPLGKEIESMLLTIASTKSSQLNLHQDIMENSSIFEEISNVTRLESDGVHRFDGVDTIENALLCPRGKQPFEPGQSRDKSTSGSLPPKPKNPNVDIKTETMIKCSRAGGNTDINVTETQRYLDKRLPYPFCTETVLQVHGTTDSLQKAAQAVENSKSELVHLSNANSPSPGMLIPKLQFNHMLSKSYDNVNPNSKKTVLKIKVVPTSDPSQSDQSLDPKPKTSHILQLTEQQSELSTDVSKLIRKSKFNAKSGPKKTRRSDSAMKLRPKKKINKEAGENITILGPKDLEKMFPTVPKPKPMEKPRKVTINTKMGKGSPNYAEAVKEHSLQGGFITNFKSRSVKDDILKKPDVLKSSLDQKVVSDLGAEVHESNLKLKPVVNEESNAGLSTRDQKILKSIISHKVKDSFLAVTKKAGELKDTDAVKSDIGQNISASHTSSAPKGGMPQEPKIGMADRTKASLESTERPHSAVGTATKPKTPISETVNNFALQGVKYDLNRSNQTFTNNSKKVYSKILIPTKEKPSKEKAPPQSNPRSRPKSPKPQSPTPAPNRQYITVKTEPTPKSAADLTQASPDKASQISNKKVDHKLDESVLPVSASTLIANVMKNSSTASQSESRWHHLDQKTATSKSPYDKFTRENYPQITELQRKPSSAPRELPETRASDLKSEVKKDEKSGVKDEKRGVKEDVSERGNKSSDKVKTVDNELDFEKKVWNHPSEPLFFPFETPNFKEVLQESSPSMDSAQPFPLTSPNPESLAVYEADFCKLCSENSPGLAATPIKYRVPLARLKKFPMVNPGKLKSYSVPATGALSISPLHDLMLRKNLVQVPAVTKVLGATLSAKSQQALERWKQGLISTLGEQGFQDFYQAQLKRGSDFHSSVRKFLVDRLDGQDDHCMRSLSRVLESVAEVSVVESQVMHPLLGYRGVIDCVAKYKGKPVVIEWKRSDKTKPTLKHTYDAPLQLSAYFGAMNFDNNYKSQVEGGIVVVAYSDGSPADVFELSLAECQRYWAKWLNRLHQFYTNSA